MVTTSEAAHAGVDSAAAETSNALKADFIFRAPLSKAGAVRSCREILVTSVSRGPTGRNADRPGAHRAQIASVHDGSAPTASLRSGRMNCGADCPAAAESGEALPPSRSRAQRGGGGSVTDGGDWPSCEYRA